MVKLYSQWGIFFSGINVKDINLWVTVLYIKDIWLYTKEIAWCSMLEHRDSLQLDCHWKFYFNKTYPTFWGGRGDDFSFVSLSTSVWMVRLLPWRRSLLIRLWLPRILSWFALPGHLLSLWAIPFSLLLRKQPDWRCRMKWWLGWKTTRFLQLFWSIELWASTLILWQHHQSKGVRVRGNQKTHYSSILFYRNRSIKACYLIYK